MDYTIRKVEVDLIALEGHLASLDAMRAELGERKVTQGLALECDALMHNYRGQGSLISLRYKYDATSKDYTVALEGIISTVWEHIKMIFAKIVEYVKKFWAWITGKSNQNTEQKAQQAEQSSQSFNEAWDQILDKLGDALLDGANATAAKVKEAGSAVGEKVTQAAHATRDAVGKAGDAVNDLKDKALGIKHPDDNTPPDPKTEQDNFKHIDQLDVKYGQDSKLLKGDNDATNPDAPAGQKKGHTFRNGKWVEDNPTGVKLTRREGMTDPKTQFHVNQIKKTAEDVRQQSDKVNDMLKAPAAQEEPHVTEHRRLKEQLTNTGNAWNSAGAERAEHEAAHDKAMASGDRETAAKHKQAMQNLDREIYSHYDTYTRTKDKLQLHEARHGKPATESIALEDAGMRQKPAEILNAMALSMKSQFLSGLPRPETLILFSPNYGAELEKLAREFARLKPIDALMKRYTAIDGWLGKAMGEAARIDAIKDINEYRPRFEDFKKSFEAEVNHIHEMPDDAEQLASDITRFHASRDDHGSDAFTIESPQTGDQLLHVASVTDTTFRVVRAVTAEIKDAGSELKRLENLFEGLSTKINTAAAGGTGNTGARDFVAHTLQSEVRLVSGKVRSIVQGLAVFTNYYGDAHRAVSRYQKFVIKVMDAALHEMHGEHEFQEEQLRSLLAKLRDANNAFERIK